MQQPTNYFTLRFSEAELNTLGLALEALPYKQAAPIFALINEQIQEALKVAQEKKDDDTITD